jgi:hypothetical protein
MPCASIDVVAVPPFVRRGAQVYRRLLSWMGTQEVVRMKWVSVYLVGYVLVVIGIAMALWKVGVLERLGGFWIGVGVVIAIGIGIILSISGSGSKETVEVNRR